MKSSIKLWNKLGRLLSLRWHVVWFYPSKFQIFLPNSKIYRTKIVNRKCWRCSSIWRKQQFLGGLKMSTSLKNSSFTNWILQKQLSLKNWQKNFQSEEGINIERNWPVRNVPVSTLQVEGERELYFLSLLLKSHRWDTFCAHCS